ncbi:LIM domain-binding protein 2 [Tyrophagus putrescentiae]|nr:LIM domain-binding protein 2 [Tyrophagus putrescentiae]
MLCGPPPLPQNGPPMTMGPYNPGPSPMPHVMHHPPHPMQHPGPPPPPNHMQPPPPHGRHTPFYEMRQPEFRIYEMNKRLWQRSEEADNLWWDAFATEFFEDDATLTVTFYLEDGPKRYTIGRTLIPRYFRSIFEGRLILEFAFDDLMRIKSWHFSTRHHQELISRSLVAMQQAQQDPSMMEQLTKNITRQGLTNSTLNYLRLCVILEPMQELMSRYKTYPLSPRDCLKTTLFQKWQRMVAPPETSRPPSKRRKRKSSTNAGATTASKKKNNQNNMSPVPPPFTLATQDVMVVGEPSLMGGEFGDEDERLITRLENNQYDPNVATGTNGLEDADDFNSLGSSTSGGGNNANNGGNSSAGIMGPGANGGPPSWPQNGSGSNNNNSNVNGANSNGGAPPPPGGANGGGPMSGPAGGSNGPNGPNSQEESKKQSPPNMSQ